MKKIIHLLFLAISLIISTLPLNAAGNKSIAPNSFIYFYLNGIEKETTLMLVEISTQKAYLISFQKSPFEIETIATFDVCTGKQRGVKDYEGDLRTPEGVYKITQFRPKGSIRAEFGSGAFVLNYPNNLDKFQSKTGSGIWIHGTDLIDFIDYDSEGCVRLPNKDIEFLTNHLKPGETLVIIEQKVEWVSEKDLVSAFTEYQKREKDWMTSWEQGDFQTYLGHYHRSFLTSDLKYDILRWKERREAEFNITKSATLLLKSNTYLSKKDLILLEAEYSYNTGSHREKGKKKILWQKKKGAWVIIQEE